MGGKAVKLIAQLNPGLEELESFLNEKKQKKSPADEVIGTSMCRAIKCD